MTDELSQEDIFANDVDPLDAIRELRKSEGVAEEDLPVSEEPSEKAQQPDPEPDVLEEFQEEEKTGEEPEETTTTSEDTDDENEEKTDEEVVEAFKSKFRANGKDFEFSQEEINNTFETVFGQAMDYTQKMQKISPYRKMISALEEEGVTSDQLNVALDALKGDKGALQKLMETHKIDAYDLKDDDDADPYEPTDYGKNEGQLDIDEVANQISGDPEYKITVDVVDNQWDSESRKALAGNPSMIQGLHNDIKSGLYDRVSPLSMKMKVLDGGSKSDIEYYMLAGEQLSQQQASTAEKTVDDLNKSTQDAEDKFDKASSEAGKKRAATSTRARADRKGVIDYLDDDDEKFDAWYKKLERSS